MSLFGGETLSRELAGKLADAEKALELAEAMRIQAMLTVEKAMRLIRAGSVADGFRRPQDTEALNVLLDGWMALKEPAAMDGGTR